MRIIKNNFSVLARPNSWIKGKNFFKLAVIAILK